MWKRSRSLFFVCLASLPVCFGLVTVTPSAIADENQFLSHLLTGNTVHPPLTSAALLNMGHQACSDIAGGVSPDFEKDDLDRALSKQGVAARGPR